MSARIDVVLNTFDAPDALDALSTHSRRTVRQRPPASVRRTVPRDASRTAIRRALNDARETVPRDASRTEVDGNQPPTGIASVR